MAITLGALALPDGLVWSDEHAWTPVAPPHGGEGPLPVYRSFAAANPTAGSPYIVSAIRLIEV